MSVHGLEHADVEKGVSLAILLSRKRDAAFCELYPSLVAALELLDVEADEHLPQLYLHWLKQTSISLSSISIGCGKMRT